MLILLVFAIDCILRRTVSLYIYIYIYIYILFWGVFFGNCVLTWCRVSVNMCDSSRGDLAGAADRT